MLDHFGFILWTSFKIVCYDLFGQNNGSSNEQRYELYDK